MGVGFHKGKYLKIQSGFPKQLVALIAARHCNLPVCKADAKKKKEETKPFGSGLYSCF